MSDIREEIYESCEKEYIHDYGYAPTKKGVFDAMDERGKQLCLELLEYMAKNKITLDIVNGEVECYLKNGEGITREQLFENFL